MAKETRKVHISVTSNASRDLNKGTVAAKGLSGSLKGVGASASAATGGIKAMTAALMSSGIGAIVVGIGALVAGLGSVISKSTEFEKALSTLEAVTGSSSSEMKQLSDLAKELGSTTAFTASQVVELQTELAKLGFKTDDIKNATGSILDLAASLGVDLGEAAEFSGSLVKSFGLSTKETQRIVDVMAKSTSSSALSFSSLRESLKLVAPVSKATGVSIEKTTALLGVLADRGLKGSIAGTGLAKTFIMLNKKGISLADGMKKVNESADPLKTAIDMVGVVAGKTFLTLASGQQDIAGLEQTFLDAEGAANKMADIKLDNLAGDTTKLASAWEGFLLSIEDGEGIINRIARGFIQATTSIINFLSPQKDAVQGIKDQQLELFKLEGRLNDTNISEEERRQVIIKLKQEYPEYLAHLDTEKATNKELSDAIAKVNDNLVNKIILARKDKEIQEQAENVADETINKLEQQDKLRQVIADNRRKFGFEATQGTLEEQALAQKQMVMDAGELMTLNEKDIALKRIRNGVGLLKRAQENLNEEQGKQSEILSEQDALYEELGIKRVEKEDEVIEEIIEKNKNKNKVLTEDELKELKESKRLRTEFLAKLKKLDQDTDDTTALEKIQRKRERHLEELKTIKMTTDEREKAKATIEAMYDQQRDAQIQLNNEKRKKIFDDFTKQFNIEAEDPSEKLAQQREAHLLELETLKLNTTEKEEAVKAIKAFYANEEAALKANDRVLKQEQDLADLETKKQLISQGLDLAIDASGQESKIGQALLKIKQAMMLAELGMKMNAYIQTMKMQAQEGLQSTAIKGAEQSASINVGFANSAKLGAPFNAIPLALMAIQAGLMIKNMAKSKKEMKKVAGRFGGGGIGGGATAPQAPNFNVIGQTSNDANLISDTIQGANSRPIRAFVVDKDVTSSQELARNTENIASIG
jgi:hypothetical protein